MIRLINRVVDGPLDGGNLGAFGGSLGVLLVATAISGIAYYVYERPAERLLRRTPRRQPA